MFITHDFGVVAEIADRVTVMRDGVLVEHGARRRFSPARSTTTHVHSQLWRQSGFMRFGLFKSHNVKLEAMINETKPVAPSDHGLQPFDLR